MNESSRKILSIGYDVDPKDLSGCRWTLAMRGWYSWKKEKKKERQRKKKNELTISSIQRETSVTVST